MNNIQNLHGIAKRLVYASSKQVDSKITDAAIQKLASYRINWYGFILEFCSSLRNRITIGRFQSSAAIICQIASENPSLTRSITNWMRAGASALEASKETLTAELTLLIGDDTLVSTFLTSAPIKSYKKIAAYPPTYQIDLTTTLFKQKLIEGSLYFPQQFTLSVLKTATGVLVDISSPYLQLSGLDLHGLFITKTQMTVHAGPLGLIRSTAPLPQKY